MGAFATAARRLALGAVNAVARSAPSGSAGLPSRQVLGKYAGRQAVAALLLLVAAEVCRAAGLEDQRTPYLLIAIALVPQVLTALVALRFESRRARLRITRHPGPLPAFVAAVLCVSAIVTAVGAWSGTMAAAGAAAALIGAGGMAVAAWPVQLLFARHA